MLNRYSKSLMNASQVGPERGDRRMRSGTTVSREHVFDRCGNCEIHGFMGWNASKTTDETQILRMADALLWAGVTAFVPSCISSSMMLDNVRALHAARTHQRQGAEILGLYMEGPFYNPEYNGGTPVQYFQAPSIERALRFYEAAGGDLVSLGLAPELPGAMEVVSFLSQNGVRTGITFFC